MPVGDQGVCLLCAFNESLDERCDVHVSALLLTLLIQPKVGWSWQSLSHLSPTTHFITPPPHSSPLTLLITPWVGHHCFLSFFLLASMAPSVPLRSPHGRLYSLIPQSFIHCIPEEERYTINVVLTPPSHAWAMMDYYICCTAKMNSGFTSVCSWINHNILYHWQTLNTSFGFGNIMEFVLHKYIYILILIISYFPFWFTSAHKKVFLCCFF